MAPKGDGRNQPRPRGRRGFDKAIWRVCRQSTQSASLTHRSPDGDEGYPGELEVTVRYSFSDSNELCVDYEAVVDQPTIVNLTNHSYFNLRGEGKGDILDHELQIESDLYTPADPMLIPTGAFASVEGTPFDFCRPRRIGDRIRDAHPHIIAGRGYDLNYVLRCRPNGLARAALVYDPVSARRMEIWTTEPGLQFYSGNLLDGAVKGASGRLYRQSDGFCLETHHYPDSPNRPEFPSPTLRPGEVYRTTTMYRFFI